MVEKPVIDQPTQEEEEKEEEEGGQEAVQTGAEEETSPQQLRERLQRLQEGAQTLPQLPTVESNLVSRFPTLGSPILDVQLASYMGYVESVGTPDILIVGSSRSLQGIDPEALSDRLSGQSNREIKVYNFSVNGATAKVVNFIVSELLPGETPPVIVWGDGSRAFNDGRRDRTWETIVSSPGYQAIQNGARPMIDVTAEVPEAIEINNMLSEVVEEEDLIEEGLTEESLTDAERLLNRLRDDATQSAEIVSTETDLRRQPSPLEQLGLNTLGFSAVGDRFDPRTYYQEFPKVYGQYDGAYSPFTLQGEQTTVLVELTDFLRSQSAQLLFINLPLSDSYLDEFRLYYETQFQRFLQTQGRRHQFEVIDLLSVWQGQPELFADPSHINQDGASAIAAQLATEPSLLSALEASIDSVDF